MLSASSTAIIRFFLYIAKDEQKRRPESRLRNSEKHWRFSSAHVWERSFSDEYHAGFEDALSNCSTAHAPWYVVHANQEWYRNLVVARTIADTLGAMNRQFPPAEAGLEKVVVPD
jgi:polyphosphate kinase 2 (PPK2 family)